MRPLHERIDECQDKGIQVETLVIANDPNNSFGISVVPNRLGLAVHNIRNDGLCALAGVVMGDILLQIGGLDMANEDALFAYFRGVPPQGSVQLVVAQYGKLRNRNVQGTNLAMPDDTNAVRLMQIEPVIERESQPAPTLAYGANYD